MHLLTGTPVPLCVIMGLDYSYIIILKKRDRPKLFSRLSTDAVFHDIRAGKCATIQFKLDKPILRYLKNSIRQTEGITLYTTLLFSPTKFPDYFSGDFGKIGCIYVDEKPFWDDDHIMVSFSAATTVMSVLFQNSNSIRDWFISLSTEVNALATFLDLEDHGVKFIYNSGKEVNVDFVDHTNVVSSDYDFYRKIYDEYDSSTYIK